MFLKRRVRRKDGEDHVYYPVCESLRVHGGRTLQRQILHLGELNTRQERSWQHTLDVINEDDGQLLQRRLFTDREGGAPPTEDTLIRTAPTSHTDTNLPHSAPFPRLTNRHAASPPVPQFRARMRNCRSAHQGQPPAAARTRRTTVGYTYTNLLQHTERGQAPAAAGIRRTTVRHTYTNLLQRAGWSRFPAAAADSRRGESRRGESRRGDRRRGDSRRGDRRRGDFGQVFARLRTPPRDRFGGCRVRYPRRRHPDPGSASPGRNRPPCSCNWAGPRRNNRRPASAPRTFPTRTEPRPQVATENVWPTCGQKSPQALDPQGAAFQK